MLAAAWIAAAIHTSLTMRRYGRRFWVWLAICVLLSVIPAVVVSYVEYFRRLREHRSGLASAPRRCPHCGSLLSGATRQVGGEEICDNCGMVVGEDRIA